MGDLLRDPQVQMPVGYLNRVSTLTPVNTEGSRISQLVRL